MMAMSLFVRYTVLLVGIVLSLPAITVIIFLIYDEIIHKNRVVVKDLGARTKNTKVHKSREYYDKKNNAKYWKIKGLRKNENIVREPPMRSIEFTTSFMGKQAKMAMLYLTPEGGKVWAVDTVSSIDHKIPDGYTLNDRCELIDPEGEVLEGKYVKSGLEPFTSAHREIFAETIREIESTRDKKPMDYFFPIAGITALILILAIVFLVGDRVYIPMENIQNNQIKFQEKLNEAVTVLDQLINNKQTITAHNITQSGVIT